MSWLRRLLGRREAMDQWRSGLERRRPAEDRRAPDALPEDVVWTGRVGFDGRRIEGQRGAITGSEAGGSGGPTPPGVP